MVLCPYASYDRRKYSEEVCPSAGSPPRGTPPTGRPQPACALRTPGGTCLRIGNVVGLGLLCLMEDTAGAEPGGPGGGSPSPPRSLGRGSGKEPHSYGNFCLRTGEQRRPLQPRPEEEKKGGGEPGPGLTACSSPPSPANPANPANRALPGALTSG